MPASPRTAAGRALLGGARSERAVIGMRKAILAIEAEAAQQAAPLDVEALRVALEWDMEQAQALFRNNGIIFKSDLSKVNDPSDPAYWEKVAFTLYTMLTPHPKRTDAIAANYARLAPAPSGIATDWDVKQGQARPADAALRIGPRVGVRLRDAFWVDSRHYDHYHDHGVTVTHEVGEWCRHQLIGQNWPCPPNDDGMAAQKVAQQPTPAEGEG